MAIYRQLIGSGTKLGLVHEQQEFSPGRRRKHAGPPATGALGEAEEEDLRPRRSVYTSAVA